MAWNRLNARFHVSKESQGRSSIIIEDFVDIGAIADELMLYTVNSLEVSRRVTCSP
jgi:hypothetical protein